MSATARPTIDVPSWLRAVLAVDPTRTAVLSGELALSWAGLAAVVDAVDAELAARDIGPGAEVGVVVRNTPGHLAAAVAVLATNRCLVTISPLLADAALVDDLRQLDVPVVLATAADWDRPGLDEVARAGGCLGLELTGDTAAPVKVRHAGRPDQSSDGSRAGVAIRMLTSGTTGTPKRVEITYRALAHSLASAAAHNGSAVDDGPTLQDRPSICWAPLVHISGLWTMIKNVADGRPTILMERFDPSAWARWIRDYQLPAGGLTPTALRMVLDAGIPADDLSSLRGIVVGTAATPPELVDRFVAAFGVPVLTVYGATEFAGAVAGWTRPLFEQWWTAKRGSVGRAYPGISLRVVDPVSGTPVPAGAAGLLEVRGGQLDGVGGASGDQWVRTTDIGRLDDDGFLSIDGRADDTIVRGGFKVSPGKVAAALERHLAVREAGVTGLPDERLGAVPVAAVELIDGAEPPSETDLVAYAREYLAPYEVPRTILVVAALPRTPSMKVSQPALRGLFGEP